MSGKEQVTAALSRMNSNDGQYFSYASIVWDGLSSDEREQLKQLLFHGPVWDGSVISKTARNQLITYGLASRCCFKGEQGYAVATYRAYSVHRAGRGDRLSVKPGIEG